VFFISSALVISFSDADLSWSIFGGVFISILVSILVFLIYAFYIKAYIKRYYYDGNDQFFTIKKGVFAPTEIHVQYKKIQDVYVDQDILDRIMGLYDVHIASATVSSGIEAHIDGVNADAAEGLKNFLLSKIQTESISTQPEKTLTGQSSIKQSEIFKFTEEISSKTYPISPRWMVAKFAVIILVNVILFAFVAVAFYFASVSMTFAFEIENFKKLILFAPLFYLLFSIFDIIYTLVWKANYKFQFLPEFIYINTKVIDNREKHIPYHTIQDVVVSQGVMDRLFGLANITIENASAINQSSVQGKNISNAVVIPGQSLSNANKISEILKGTILTKNTSQAGL
jgi:putative membrane protein